MLGLCTEKYFKSELEQVRLDYDSKINKLLTSFEVCLLAQKELLMTQLRTDARSNQAKYNDHESRLKTLDAMLAGKIKAFKANIEKREMENARDVDEGLA